MSIGKIRALAEILMKPKPKNYIWVVEILSDRGKSNGNQ